MGKQNTVDNNALCYFYNDVVPSAASVKITCNKPLFGRYVSIQKINPGADATDILAICEVKVFGIDGESLITKQTGHKLDIYLIT